MTTRFYVSLLVVTALILWCGACTQQKAPAIDPSSPQLKVFSTLPASMASEENPATDAKVKLGRMLYFEKRVSKAQDISCNDCHNLQTFGVTRADIRWP
jgi:cytochrome c peroxidase